MSTAIDKHFQNGKASGLSYQQVWNNYKRLTGVDDTNMMNYMGIYDGTMSSEGFDLPSLINNKGANAVSSVGVNNNIALGAPAGVGTGIVGTRTIAPVVTDPAGIPDVPLEQRGGLVTEASKSQSELYKAGGVNNLTGNNPWMSMAGAFGDKNSTGWAVPAATAVNAVAKTYLGYQELQATKENNAEKLALMEEANFMKKLQMKNQVNQANRYAMLGMGNSNNQVATARAAAVTPYTSMNLK